MCATCSPAAGPIVERPPSPASPPEAREAIALRHAADYVVAPGLRWLVATEPSALLSALNAAQAPWPAPARIAAFEHAVGVTLKHLSEAVIAGFDYSTLYVARSAPQQEIALDGAFPAFHAHLTTSPITRNVLDLSFHSGTREETPEHFVRFDPSTVGWSEGDPSSLKAAALLSRHRLTATRSALLGASLSLLPADCHRGTLVLYLPGPIAPDLDASAHLDSGVLELLLAGSVSLTIRESALHMSGCVVGDWSDDGRARVSALLNELLHHRFTSLLELGDAEREFTIEQQDAVVRFAFTWPTQHTLSRVQAILELDLVHEPDQGPSGSSSPSANGP